VCGKEKDMDRVYDGGGLLGRLEGRSWCRWRPTVFHANRDPVESARVGHAVRAVPGQCWLNARRAILRLAEYAGATYVEGWAVFDDVLPIEHAWVRRGNAVIDPTMPDKRAVYFPGLEVSGRQEIASFLKAPEGRKCKNTPFFYAFGWGGMDCPSFRAAGKAALAYLRERAGSPPPQVG
jgi:hypothetical protein